MKTSCNWWHRALAIAILLLFSSALSFAKDSSITQMGRTINVGPDQSTGDLTCFGCSIHVRGAHVSGDVTSFGGSITVEDQAQIAGDISGFGGNIRIGKDVSVAGDVAVFGGTLSRDPESQVAGDVTSMSGRGWLVAILALPFVIFGLFVALVVWLIQRARRPTPAHA